MIDKSVIRGLFLAAIGLIFGLSSLRYTIGNPAHAGPGFVPLIVSCLLLALSGVMIVQSRFTAPIQAEFMFKNVSLVLLGMVGFVVMSKYINMTLGIVVLVFIAAIAGTSYSWKQNVRVSIGLIAVAYAFQKLLGLNLGLY